MTEEEGNLYITLATLHGPSTRDEICDDDHNPHAPLVKGAAGWWVDRDPCLDDNNFLYDRDFPTRAEAARHYCLHYGLIKP
jgi:hypothetical protein